MFWAAEPAERDMMRQSILLVAGIARCVVMATDNWAEFMSRRCVPTAVYLLAFTAGVPPGASVSLADPCNQ
jgi:hypothetical protein